MLSRNTRVTISGEYLKENLDPPYPIKQTNITPASQLVRHSSLVRSCGSRNRDGGMEGERKAITSLFNLPATEGGGDNS